MADTLNTHEAGFIKFIQPRRAIRVEKLLRGGDKGRDKLRAYGIAPPEKGGTKRELLYAKRRIPCPRCESTRTEVVSEFGSTACKASYRCRDCLEPFEYFKCI